MCYLKKNVTLAAASGKAVAHAIRREHSATPSSPPRVATFYHPAPQPPHPLPSYPRGRTVTPARPSPPSRSVYSKKNHSSQRHHHPKQSGAAEAPRRRKGSEARHRTNPRLPAARYGPGGEGAGRLRRAGRTARFRRA
jgi:hypothetical protein